MTTEKRKDLLIWIDLETTGLDCDNQMQGVKIHKILEIGMHITDSNFNIIDNGLEIIVHHNQKELENLMAPIVKEMHQQNGLLEKVQKSSTSLKEAEKMMLEYVNSFNIEEKSSPICGNNVGFDKNFIDAQMPIFSKFLHYRKIDVSSFKEFAARQFPEVKELINKKGSHRALGDIVESIEELRKYQEQIFIPKKEINNKFKLK